MFRLLELANHSTTPDAIHVTLAGKKWVINEYKRVSDAPEYTCISYAWGDGKAKSPLYDHHQVSDRTIRVLETAVGVSNSTTNWDKYISFSHNGDATKETAGQAAAVHASQALWIDALCVPTQEPARTACLQSMGEIFSSAYQVLVVFTDQCSDAIQNTLLKGKLTSTDLSLLESEDWVSRAWTYQEAVNSKRLYFAIEQNNDLIVSGHDFLNAIMVAIDAYKEAKNFDKLTWEKHNPKLRSLERLLADYLISDFATRSAYQVMAVMDHRVSERADDHFYAMVGAITTTTLQINGDETLRPSEYFTRVCEEKGDFSFLYSTAPREETLGRAWRPLEGRFPALLPDLITLGSTEAGQAEQTHLLLNNVYRPSLDAITPDGLKAARWFVEDKNEARSPNDVAAKVLERLRILGFSGCGAHMELETGFFFPQSAPLETDDLFVVVSHEIHWVTGGPGLLLRKNKSAINDFVDVGAFVGTRPKSGDGIKVG